MHKMTRAEWLRHPLMAMSLREVTDADRPWLRALVEQEWGLPVVTPSGTYHSPETHEGVIAEVDGERAGAVTYLRDGGDWEIVTVISTVKAAGVGRSLLEEVRRRAERSGATRVWLITTGDTGAATFYEHLGMSHTRKYENFVELVRRAKPSTGGYRDAFEFEWRVRPEA